MSPVIVHLPKGYPRTLRANDAAGLSHLGYRVWEALLARLCEPTCRSVAARFDVHRDTAARALRSLIKCGLLWRPRPRSAGPGTFAWSFVVTDAPFAWLDTEGLDDPSNADLADRMQRAHDAELDRLRRWRGHDNNDPVDPHPVPAPEISAPPHEPPQPTPAEPSCPQEDQVSSCPTDADISFKDSPKEISPPTPSPVDQVVHRPSRFERRLLALRRTAPELQPHLPDALALLHGLEFPPLLRLQHAAVVARALHSGRSPAALAQWLTRGISTARHPQRVMAWRLRERLRPQLDREVATRSRNEC